MKGLEEVKEKEPLISIIILNYNAGNLLLECVESIYNSNYKNFEIIVVDNVSKDNSDKKCKEKFSDIILIENEKNLGYCGGNNVGIETAKGDFLVILNPDVIVKVDSRYFRPSEVETLLGDPSNAKIKLGWVPEITVQDMCSEMVCSDLREAKRIKLLREHGYQISLQSEG